MQLLSDSQFQQWRTNAKVLEQDRYGEKVLLLADGTMVKLFRRKSWFSKTVFFPPAQRFADNTAALSKLDIPCPQVINTYKLLNPYRSVVHYHPLAGDTLRHVLREPAAASPELMRAVGAFIARLHELGVYFRSLHLGNIILTPDSGFGLIDISDLACKRAALSAWQRQRNLRHLLRYAEDWQCLSPAALKQMADGYQQSAASPAMHRAMRSFKLLQ